MFPATAQASKDTPREEEKGFSYDESIQGHPKEEGRGKKERGRRPKTGVPSYAQASRDTPKRGVYLSVTFRNTPKKKERRRGGEGEEGD